MNQPLKETVYSAESGLKSGTIFKEIIDGWISSFSLGKQLFLRNFRSQYRQSFLGVLWSIIPPLLTAGVWIFLNGQSIINIEQPGVPYPAFILTSTMLWALFGMSLQMPMNALQGSRSLLVKLNFPRESVLVAGLLQILVDMGIRIGLIIIVFIVFQVTPGLSLVYAPLGLLMLMMLGFTLGLLITPLSMLYNDVSRFVGAFLPFWMLLTPVIYPNPRAGLGEILNRYNPVSPILSTTRDWIFDNEPTLLIEFMIMSALVLVLFIIGNMILKLSMTVIIERIGS
ncbi:MAG: ABC transporter permease [Cyclobacteriaceae bacterium]